MVGTIVAVACAAALSSPAGAQASFLTGEGCDEHQGFFAGDEAAVAARLPDSYEPVRDEASGRPLVFARAIRCANATLEGRSGPGTMASYGVVIESPDGQGCGSGMPVIGEDGDGLPICNWYVLGWQADDRRVVRWLRRGTPSFPVAHAPGMTFELGEVDPARGGAPFHFESPDFTLDDVGRPRPEELSVRVGYWYDTPQGTVKLAGSSEHLTSGDAIGGEVRAAPGSELAALLGGERQQFLAGYAALGAERFAHGSYRKQVIGPAPRTNSFAGTCSLSGDVTFDPPATNVPTPLVYSYQATGTCSGTLDGRDLVDAPVTVQHSGPADGACTRARTTGPGVGAITFEDGTRIGYTLDFSSVGTEVTATVYGDRSGWGRAQGTFANDRTPPDISAQCAGPGARQAPLDVELETDQPLVSQRDALRLSVTPRRVRAGSRRTFAFRVTSRSAGAAVAGALVRFAGRSVTTGANGRGSVVARLRRPGRRVVRVTAEGFPPARAVVRVRRAR
jgi:hypothetical protein